MREHKIRRISSLKDCIVISNEEHDLFRKRREKQDHLYYCEYVIYYVTYGTNDRKERTFVFAKDKLMHDNVEKFVLPLLEKDEKIYGIECD